MIHARRRRFSGEADKLAMAALARAFPAHHLHGIDLPYRFSSWALDDPENVALWVDAGDQVLAWAIMQAPFWSIDDACQPGADQSLHRQILSWADQRARQLLRTPGGRPAWFVFVFADQLDRIQDLEEAGFTSQAEVGEEAWSKVWMLHSKPASELDCTIPKGFTIRPLAGAGEVDDYVALHRSAFESKNMTVEWRRHMLQRVEYRPELDLVAVGPEGNLAAFCIGWLAEVCGELRGQIEPLGVCREYRGLGLGKAILSECLHRMYLHGAGKIFVETDHYRNTALAVYESVGFRVIQDVLVFRKDFQENPS